MTLLIDGQTVAASLFQQLKKTIQEHHLAPTLAIVICGQNPASLTYTKIKQKRATEIGINCTIHSFPEQVTEEKVISTIHELNNSVDGIIVQMPLPTHLNQQRVVNAIDPAKDIDGLTEQQQGRLFCGDEKNRIVPATPKGIIRLLDAYAISLLGKNVVIINRSTLVGKPLALLFLQRHATVTVCHSATSNLSVHTSQADILVSATGVPHLIRENMVKSGAIVIDVGIVKQDDKLVGDVLFDEVKNKAFAITPVPGGVGPMTVAMVLENVVEQVLKKKYNER